MLRIERLTKLWILPYRYIQKAIARFTEHCPDNRDSGVAVCMAGVSASSDLRLLRLTTAPEQQEIGNTLTYPSTYRKLFTTARHSPAAEKNRF